MNPWLHGHFECIVSCGIVLLGINHFFRPNYDKDLSDMVPVIVWVVPDRGPLGNYDSTSKLAIIVESSEPS